MRHSCSYCTLQFKSIGNLESHIQARHSKCSRVENQPELNDTVYPFYDNDGPTEAFHYKPTEQEKDAIMNYSSRLLATSFHDNEESVVNTVLKIIKDPQFRAEEVQFTSASTMKKLLESKSDKMLKKTIHLGGSEYMLYYYDIFQIINELIQSATKLYFNFQEKYCNGKRVFEEVWTADWWREQEMKINDVVSGAKLLCLILFSDETHLTENGKHKSYPLNLSLGNILQSERGKNNGRRLLAYLPIIKGKNKAKYKIQLLHKCLEIVLEPLLIATADGFWIKDRHSENHLFFPKIGMYISDWIESLKLCMIRGKGSKKGCHFCLNESTLFNQVPSFSEKRTVSSMIQILEEAKELKRNRKGKDSEELLKDFSLFGCEEIPFLFKYHQELGFDIYQQTVIDQIHMFDRGLFEWIFIFLFLWIKENFSTPQANKLISEIDKRIKELSNFPSLHTFESIIDQARFKASELRSIQKIIIVALADMEGLQNVLQAFLTYNDLYEKIKCEFVSDLDEIEKLIKKFSEKFLFFKSLSSLNFPKFHCLNHVIECIKQFGRTMNYSSEAEEKSHQQFSKVPFRRSNFRNYADQMARFNQRKKIIQKLGNPNDKKNFDYEVGGLNSKSLIAAMVKTYPKLQDLLQKFFPKDKISCLENIEIGSYARTQSGSIARVKEKFHNKIREDTVLIKAEDDLWFANLKILFKFRHQSFALVQWFEYHKTHQPSELMIYKKGEFDVILIASIIDLAQFYQKSKDLYYLNHHLYL